MEQRRKSDPERKHRQILSGEDGIKVADLVAIVLTYNRSICWFSGSEELLEMAIL